MEPIFSVVILTKNNIATLPKTIDSLDEFLKRGGELILIDTGSTDGTQDYGRERGARVVEAGDQFMVTLTEEDAQEINHKYVAIGEEKGDVVKAGEKFFAFDRARNFGASHAKNNFICNMDSDEAWSILNIDKLEDQIRGGQTRFSYNFVFSHKPDGTPDLEFITDSRLYDRQYWHWECGIHETLFPNENTNGSIMYLGKDVLYLEHWQVPAPTRRSYLPGLAYYCYNGKHQDRHSHYFAREMMYYGYFRSAIKEFLHHIEISGWDVEKSQSMIFIGDCFRAVGNEDYAINWYNEAFKTSARREPLMRLAQIYFNKKDHKRALAYASAAVNIKHNGYYGETLDYFGSLPYQWIAWAQFYLGDKHAAREAYKEAALLNPMDLTIIGDRKWYL